MLIPNTMAHMDTPTYADMHPLHMHAHSDLLNSSLVVCKCRSGWWGSSALRVACALKSSSMLAVSKSRYWRLQVGALVYMNNSVPEPHLCPYVLIIARRDSNSKYEWHWHALTFQHMGIFIPLDNANGQEKVVHDLLDYSALWHVYTMQYLMNILNLFCTMQETQGKEWIKSQSCLHHCFLVAATQVPCIVSTIMPPASATRGQFRLPMKKAGKRCRACLILLVITFTNP